LSGRVLHGQVPVARAIVTVGYPRRTIIADETGTYRLSMLPAGSYDVEAESPSGDARSQVHSVELGIGEEVTDVDLELESGASASGRVVDAVGAPVAGAQVTLARRQVPRDSQTARTLPDGRFKVPWLGGVGQYAVLVFPPGNDKIPYETPASRPFPVIDVP